MMRVLQGAAAVLGLGAALAAPLAATAADVKAGEALFKQTCNVCHSPEVGVNKVGPSLWNVFGRKVASVPDYNYSAPLKAAAQSEWKQWDEQHLDAYLSNPRTVLKGVKMFYAVPDAADRANVIAYLRSLR